MIFLHFVLWTFFTHCSSFLLETKDFSMEIHLFKIHRYPFTCTLFAPCLIFRYPSLLVRFDICVCYQFKTICFKCTCTLICLIHRESEFVSICKRVSDKLEICGFMDLQDIASPPTVSRHLVLPVASKQKQNNTGIQAKQNHIAEFVTKICVSDFDQANFEWQFEHCISEDSLETHKKDMKFT